jgi:hypothetical protein
MSSQGSLLDVVGRRLRLSQMPFAIDQDVV